MPRLREPALGRWRPSGMKRFLPLVAAAGLIVAACASGSPSGSSATTGEPPSTSTMPAAATGVLAALAPAGDCDALLDYFIDQALSQVGPYGLGGWGGPIVDAVAEEAATDSAGDGGGQPAGGEDPTSTNVQVEGVDEGDIVKAAGDHLYVLSGQRLIGFSTAGGGLEKLGSLSLGSGFGGGEMLLHGDRLVIVGTGWDVRPLVGAQADVVPPGWSFAQITLVDVSDPADPSVIRRLTFDGTVVT